MYVYIYIYIYIYIDMHIYRYKINREVSMRTFFNASINPEFDPSAGPVGPHECQSGDRCKRS